MGDHEPAARRLVKGQGSFFFSPCSDTCQFSPLACPFCDFSSDCTNEGLGFRLLIVALSSVARAGRFFFLTLTDTSLGFFVVSAVLMSRWSWKESYWKGTWLEPWQWKEKDKGPDDDQESFLKSPEADAP